MLQRSPFDLSYPFYLYDRLNLSSRMLLVY